MNLCLSYPVLSAEDRDLITKFRKLHDQKYVDVVETHWTMVFPSSCEPFTEDQLVNEIQSVADRYSPINFCSRYAMVYDDDGCDDYYIFLVPDEGFSEICLLHDQLYSGILRPSLRLDLPFVPHLGIATHKDKDYLYELASEWNQAGHEISGVIDSLSLCSYDGKKVSDTKQFKLNN